MEPGIGHATLLGPAGNFCWSEFDEKLMGHANPPRESYGMPSLFASCVYVEIAYDARDTVLFGKWR